jgi:hypothetical protein
MTSSVSFIAVSTGDDLWVLGTDLKEEKEKKR